MARLTGDWYTDPQGRYFSYEEYMTIYEMQEEKAWKDFMNERESKKIKDPKPEIRKQMWEADPMHEVLDLIIQHKDNLEDINVEILKNGDGKGDESSLHLYNISAYELLLKLCGGRCTDDELATLDKDKSIINDCIEILYGEEINIVTKEAECSPYMFHDANGRLYEKVKDTFYIVYYPPDIFTKRPVTPIVALTPLPLIQSIM